MSTLSSNRESFNMSFTPITADANESLNSGTSGSPEIPTDNITIFNKSVQLTQVVLSKFTRSHVWRSTYSKTQCTSSSVADSIDVSQR